MNMTDMMAMNMTDKEMKEMMGTMMTRTGRQTPEEAFNGTALKVGVAVHILLTQDSQLLLFCYKYKVDLFTLQSRINVTLRFLVL